MQKTQAIFTLILAVGILSLTARALSTRHVFLRGGYKFTRANEPRRYWFFVMFFGLCGSIAFAVAMYALFTAKA